MKKLLLLAFTVLIVLAVSLTRTNASSRRPMGKTMWGESLFARHVVFCRELQTVAIFPARYFDQWRELESSSGSHQLQHDPGRVAEPIVGCAG